MGTPSSLNLLGWVALRPVRDSGNREVQAVRRGSPSPCSGHRHRQCGANSIEPSSGWLGTGGGGAGAGSGGGRGGGGAGGGDGPGGGSGGFGITAAAGGSRRVRVVGTGRAAPTFGCAVPFARLGRVSNRGLRGKVPGSPTSAASGGGSGARSSPGSTCNATSPATTTPAAFPTQPQRTRTPRISCQDPSPSNLSPSRGAQRRTIRTQARDRDPLRTACTSRSSESRTGRSTTHPSKLREEGVPVPRLGRPSTRRPYANCSRNSAMSRNCSSTQSPGLRE